jgi:hypothetical protein
VASASAVNFNVSFNSAKNPNSFFGVNMQVEGEFFVSDFCINQEKSCVTMNETSVGSIIGLEVNCKGGTNVNIKNLPVFKENFLKSLRQYKVINCPVKTVSSNNFNSLGSLQWLYLIFNDLHDVPGDSFANLVQLETLKLSKNKIQTLKEETFAKLINLTFLDLSYNKLKTLPMNLLNHFKVVALDLAPWKSQVVIKIEEGDRVKPMCDVSPEFDTMKSQIPGKLETGTNLEKPNDGEIVVVVILIAAAIIILDLSVALIYTLRQIK